VDGQESDGEVRGQTYSSLLIAVFGSTAPIALTPSSPIALYRMLNRTKIVRQARGEESEGKRERVVSGGTSGRVVVWG
jgi:hypothetical protein